MQYIKATVESVEEIYQLVQQTIFTIYPMYYPKDIVEFFCSLHNRKNIQKDIEDEHVRILLLNEQVIGTGCCIDNHITRVFVMPRLQGQGYGSYIMNQLETEISQGHDKVCLDASLAASCIYEKRGYKTIKHEKIEVNNKAVLVYEVMEKQL